MKRFLVVLDGSVQGNLALDRALEIASAEISSELILLHITPLLPSWQKQRDVSLKAHVDISKRITGLALAKAKSRGVTARARVESGEKADVAAKIAREERCDHIFMPEGRRTSVAQMLFSLTGLSMGSASRRTRSLSSLPVTVFVRDGLGEI